jgi:hypothetical protein
VWYEYLGRLACFPEEDAVGDIESLEEVVFWSRYRFVS